MIVVEYTPKESLAVQISEIEVSIISKLKNLIAKTAEKIKEETQHEMQFGKKTGRIYRYKGRDIRASAPGEVPAVRSGNLKNSIRVAKSKSGLEAVIGTKVDYAKYLKVNRPIVDFGLAKVSDMFVSDIKMLIKEAANDSI